jgi:hypothetical protein
MMKIKKEIKNICFQFINYIAKMGGLRKVLKILLNSTFRNKAQTQQSKSRAQPK